MNNTLRTAGILIMLSLSLLQAPRALQGQTSFGAIVGTITDQSEAAIPAPKTLPGRSSSLSNSSSNSKPRLRSVRDARPGVDQALARHWTKGMVSVSSDWLLDKAPGTGADCKPRIQGPP